MPRRTGRPTCLTPDLAEQIYARLWAGQSLMALCRHPPQPSKTTLYRWRAEHPHFDQNIAAILRQRPAGPRPGLHRGLVSYSPERAEQVLTRLAAGESQRSVARDPAMPCVMTLLAWSRADPEFAARRAFLIEAAPRKPQPRRTLWSERLATRICHRLIRGESLESVCRRKGFPSARTVHAWIEARPQFARDYRMAVEMGQEVRDDQVFARRMRAVEKG